VCIIALHARTISTLQQVFVGCAECIQVGVAWCLERLLFAFCSAALAPCNRIPLPCTDISSPLPGSLPAGVPVNIITRLGFPVRSDNTTGFTYVGGGDGSTLPEQYVVYSPLNEGSTVPIQPGETAIIRNLQTGLFCRLAPMQAGYPLSVPVPLRLGRALLASSAGVAATSVSAKCTTFGILADQPTAATATILTYDGYGMRYQGVPLVQSPGTATLILSNATECSIPGGNLLSFLLVQALPPAPAPAATAGAHLQLPLAGAWQA
jgi:hypothetical protein